MWALWKKKEVSMAVSPAASPQTDGRPMVGAADRAPEERKGPGAALWLLVLPVLCCGGPAIVATLAAAGAATLGVAGGVIGALLLAVALGLVVRHRRRTSACCSPAPKAWRP